ncbi:hypothetical protein PVAP13_6NG118300 [Panicum virgatum]|uniref:Uncharacterized protein n=1 Tax=Panicum virgatum TaxID=38727 RepID=A0A8T0R002_PANVG|nr:hypothetical protein PVAP13_6NG118300 [Panicum virgatum]
MSDPIHEFSTGPTLPTSRGRASLPRPGKPAPPPPPPPSSASASRSCRRSSSASGRHHPSAPSSPSVAPPPPLGLPVAAPLESPCGSRAPPPPRESPNRRRRRRSAPTRPRPGRAAALPSPSRSRGATPSCRRGARLPQPPVLHLPVPDPAPRRRPPSPPPPIRDPQHRVGFCSAAKKVFLSSSSSSCPRAKRLAGASLLVFANKQDIQGALKPAEIAKGSWCGSKCMICFSYDPVRGFLMD